MGTVLLDNLLVVLCGAHFIVAALADAAASGTIMLLDFEEAGVVQVDRATAGAGRRLQEGLCCG